MKKIICTLSVIAVISLAHNLMAYPSSDYEGKELSSFAPNFVPTEQTTSAIESAISRASSTSTHLGTDMSKDASAATKLKDNSWFSSPAVYAETSWTGSNDKRPAGVNSDRAAVSVGFDFLTVHDIVIGLLYGYSHDWGQVDESNADIDNNNNTVTLYAAKNFSNWFNVGGTLSYTNIDSEVGTPTTAGDVGLESDIISPSVYLGLSHTWNALSASSTLSYLYNDESIDNKTPTATDFDQSTGNLLWLNKLSYNISDMFTVSGLFNMTQILHSNINDNTPPPAGSNVDHNWGTVGAEITCYPAQNWDVTTGVRYDVFNENYQETVTVSLGATYSF
jgi:hypothetical protein